MAVMAKKQPLPSASPALLHPDELGQWVGQRLAQHRLAAGLTREALAVRAGVAPQTIKVVENQGRSSLETLLRLISALSLTERLESFLALAPPTSIEEIAEREALVRRRRGRRKPRAA